MSDAICLECSESFTYSGSVKYKYCSNKCQQWFQTKKKIESGNYTAPMAKRYLLKIRGIECEICGITEWCGQPVPLVLDHINGNSDNNALDNLRLVCGNCDMQLPTYKSKNRGNGRHSRRIRYEAGQSY